MMTAHATAEIHPLDGYRLRAVVDWVEVRVTLAGPSQPQHVRARIAEALPHWGKPPYITPETEHPSRTATTFVFRVQDAQGPDQLMADIQALRRPGDLPLTEHDVEIIAVEVALDAYPRTPTARADLAGAADHFFLHHAQPPAGIARLCFERGRRGGETAHYNSRRFRACLVRGGSINCGDADANYRSRYYIKSHDTIDGRAYRPLPIDEHRARMEITLAGASVPFTTLAGWRSYGFQSLASLLALRRATEVNRLPLLALLRTQLRQGGEPYKVKGARYHRKFRADTVADSLANGRIRDSLRALTRHQGGAKPRAGVPKRQALLQEIWAQEGPSAPIVDWGEKFTFSEGNSPFMPVPDSPADGRGPKYSYIECALDQKNDGSTEGESLRPDGQAQKYLE